MKKLSKRDLERRTEVLAKLQAAEKQIDEAIVVVNSVIDEKVNAAITRYNEAVSELESLRDDIVAEMESYVGDRSEKWQEGDAGQAYEEWKSEWEGLDVSELDMIEALELPDTPHAAELEALPSEPNG
jgi:uncharacterized protein YukE